MNTDDKGTTTDVIPAIREGPTRAPRRPGQTLACGWCGVQILSRRVVGPRSGARPRADTGPGNSPARPRQDSPQSRLWTMSSR